MGVGQQKLKERQGRRGTCPEGQEKAVLAAAGQ